MSPKILKLRANYKTKKSNLKTIESSVIYEIGDDRPYLKVKLGDTEIIGLIDSGCNIICLGEGSLELLKTLYISYTPLESSLKSDGFNLSVLDLTCQFLVF